VREIFDRKAKLDSIITFDVSYPPGSTTGGQVDYQQLNQLSVESSPRWRALIAASSISWIPGQTRYNNLWIGDAKRYPILTAKDRRRFAFGEDDAKNRTLKEIDSAWDDLPGFKNINHVAINPKTGETGWLIVPDAAAKAIQKKSKRRSDK